MSEFYPIDDVVIAKIGTNVIAEVAGDGSENLNPEAFNQVGQSVMSAREAGYSLILVTSAGISAGMQQTGVRPRPSIGSEIKSLQWLSSVGWRPLLNLWDAALPSVVTAGIQLTRHELEDDALTSERQEALNTIYTTLANGGIPIINENDAISHGEITFGDNDILAGTLAAHIGRSALFGSEVKLVLLTDVDGIYTDIANSASLLRVVHNIAASRKHAVDTISKNGRGGIESKYDAAEIAKESGIETFVANGLESDAIQRAITGEIGTRFKIAA